MQRIYAWMGAVCTLVLCWPMAGCSGGGGSAATYEVAGQVEGLRQGEAVVLQLNGGDDLTITADGSFRFARELPAGAQYTVSVLTGPCDAVTIENAAGRLASDVSNVTIRCATWSVPFDAADALSPIGSDANKVAVAIADNGDMAVVFEQYNDRDEDQVFLAENRDGAWSVPVDLTDHLSFVDFAAEEPTVALAPNGDLLIAWSQFNGNNDQIFVAERRSGVWAMPVDLLDSISPGGSNAYQPQAAFLADGGAVVTWYQHDGSNNRIFKSEQLSGVWSHPTTLTDSISPPGYHAYSPVVAAAANGDIVIAYQLFDGSRQRVAKSERRGGSWAHAMMLSDVISPAGQHAFYIKPAIADNGDTLIVWVQSSGAEDQAFLSEYRDGSWTHPSGLVDHISPVGEDVESVDVAMAPDGDALVVWSQYDGDGAEAVFVSRLENGVWKHPSGLADNLTVDNVECDQPTVAMNHSDAVIGYVRPYGSYDSVYVIDYRDDEWQEPLRLAPVLADAWEPRAGMNSAGQAVIAWQAWTNSSDRVYGCFYR